MTRVSKPRVGRRGALLLVLGMAFFTVGVNLFISQNDPALLQSYSAPVALAPLTAWGGVFMSVGAISFAASFLRIGRDAWGFMALVAVASVWAVGGAVTAMEFGVTRAWITALTWGAFTAIILITSGMRGPHDD